MSKVKPQKVVQWIEPSAKGHVLCTQTGAGFKPSRVLLSDLAAMATGARWLLLIGDDQDGAYASNLPKSMPEFHEP